MIARTYLNTLTERAIAVISESPDPQATMREIAQAAERSGLIDSPGDVRMEDPEEFVRDLLVDNPRANDLLNLNAEMKPNPETISDLSELLDAIP